MRRLGPQTDGECILADVDVDEPLGTEECRLKMAQITQVICRVVCGAERGGKETEVGVLRDGGHGLSGEVGICDFEVTAGSEVLEGLLVDEGPVGEGAGEAAEVDEVEGDVVSPFVAGVVEVEGEVGKVDVAKGVVKDADVRGDDGAVGVGVAHFDGPVTWTSADVEDARGIGDNGGGG